TTVTGKVTDADTGEGMPFVNVYFKGTQIGTITDFDGLYKITTDTPTDSLVASYIGYGAKTKFIVKGKVNTGVNFQLKPEATMLQTVVVTSGKWENPAWAILRKVMEHKHENDHRKLDAYQYESYTKVEFDVDNITEKFKEKKAVRKILNIIDSLEKIAGEDGKPILPLFIAETLSETFYTRHPQKRKRENVLKTNYTGIGFVSETVVTQMVGSTFQDYNFYENWLSILTKDFISPIADGWRVFYDYELYQEMEVIDGIRCYKIDFKPKRPEDLAFVGTMWIADSTHRYALKQIDVTVGKGANLNFIDKIKIQQVMEEVEGGAWLPKKTRVLVDVGDVKDDWAGMLAKFYVSNKNFVVNKPFPPSFYEQGVVVAEDATLKESVDFWNQHRHEPLSETEMAVYQTIDTIKNLPTVRTYVEMIDIAINGYKELGKFDIGTYGRSYAWNDFEGHRFRLGFRTTRSFSKKLTFNGYAALGTQDQRFKYGIQGTYLFSRKKWALLGISHEYDVEQVGISNDDFIHTYLFQISARFFNLSRPYYQTMNKVWVETDITRGIRLRGMMRNRNFDPQFSFEYYHPERQGERKSEFMTTELVGELRIAMGEKYVQNSKNERVVMGDNPKPIITFRYIRSFRNFLGSDFDYHKFYAEIMQSFRFGALGVLDYRFQTGFIPSRIPYPLLEIPFGVRGAFYNINSFNTMKIAEFATDRFLALRFQHRFEGLFFNRIPLLRKLKWREVATANLLFGSLQQHNLELIPSYTTDGTPILGFYPMRKDPYIEVGYGIENIFKFLRVDVLHRLNYLNLPDAQPIVVRFSAQFRL
ncbi:MAG: DUF5686 family protein, partial [Flammeovirgaceae bacterium]|nr:DUF5686 family protein [Flammeovirgaceae bacterium]